jgi:hypothetical protein
LKLHRRLAGLLAGLCCLVLAPPAVAAPVTVNLRIEGPTRTLFEDPVTVDTRTFHFTGDGTQHVCNGTAANHGPSATPAPTRGAAVAQAIDSAGLVAHGTWSDSLGSPSFSDIGGENVSFDGSNFLGEYKNEAFAQHGACGDPVANGDRVLFAYGDGGEQLLALTGPATARPDQAFAVKVTDAKDGSPVPGADLGDATTGADGTATVGPFPQRGDHDLKADKSPGAIRSNRLRVCVTDGADGACGTTVATRPVTPAGPDATAPLGKILGIRSGQRFKRKRAPRNLHGTVSSDPSGLRAVKLSLTRSARGRCQLYSPTKERFRNSRCGRRVNFRIGDREDWSYLLPKRPGKGRYVLDVIAVDKAGNRDKLARGRNRVVFFVR